MRRKRQIRSLLNVSLNSFRVPAIQIVFNFLIFIYLYNLISFFHERWLVTNSSGQCSVSPLVLVIPVVKDIVINKEAVKTRVNPCLRYIILLIRSKVLKRSAP